MFEKYFQKHNLKPKTVYKNDVLQRPGGVASRAYFVKSGLLRSYLIDDNGKVHTFMFAPEGWIISDIESHTLSTPAVLFIEALEISEIIEIDQISLDAFSSSEKDNSEIVGKLFRRIAALQKRVLLLMSAPAQQRYEQFLITYPQLVDRVPNKMIASYLGITPQALSNIRRKMRTQE